MTSRGEKLYYVLSLVCIITGVLGALTYVFYLSRGGNYMYSGESLQVGVMIRGVFAYLLFRALPGFLGWRGCKKRNPNLVKISFSIMLVAVVMSLGVQPYIPGVGTGWILPGIYLLISLRYMRALTQEQREKDSKWIQKATDGPRLQK